jgi:predicted kinase
MTQVHLIVGPVGAGKSTFALNLARQHTAVRFALDEWMTTLFGADPRPDSGRVEWYRERARRCIEQIFRQTVQLVECGTSAILEIGLIRRDERLDFYRRAQAAGLGLTVYVLDAPREVRRARVERRNQERGPTFSMWVPPEIFELASDLWEPPDEDERLEVEMRFSLQS